MVLGNMTEEYNPQEAFEAAIVNQDFELAKSLFDTYGSDISDAYDASTFATTSGNLEFIQYIYERDPVNSNAMGDLFVAIPMGFLNVAQWLYDKANGEASDGMMMAARVLAESRGRTNIVAWIDDLLSSQE